MVGVKDLVAGHHRHQILCVGQIDDIMGPAGDHVHRLDLFTADLKFHGFSRVDIALLDQTVTIHHNKLLPLGVMGPAGDHVHRLDLFTADLKFHGFSRVDIALLDQTVTIHHNKLLPLGVMPMLSFRDAGLRDVDGHLTAVGGMHQLRKAAPVVAVHLHGILELLLGQVGQVQRKQLLGSWHT